jgi:hypothetical protein
VNPASAGLQILTAKTPNNWQGDFDGDGKPDSLQAVAVAANFQPTERMQMLNLWDKAALKPPSPMALSLKHGNGNQEFLLYAATYFTSPIWRSPQLPLEIIQQGSPIHKLWQKQVKALKGDGIVLSTEAGVDTLLYWDGKTYRLFLPPEQP